MARRELLLRVNDARVSTLAAAFEARLAVTVETLNDSRGIRWDSTRRRSRTTERHGDSKAVLRAKRGSKFSLVLRCSRPSPC